MGAFLNSSLFGNDLETNNYDLIRGYDDYNFGIGGPVLGIPKLRFGSQASILQIKTLAFMSLIIKYIKEINTF